MTKIRKVLSLLLCVCMLISGVAFAESTATELADDTVLATINGENVTLADINENYQSLLANYGSYYDMTLTENVQLFRAVALENTLAERVMLIKAKELGLDVVTPEEDATTEAEAVSSWNSALESYKQQFYPNLTDESSEEDKAAAQAEAEKYFGEMGYSKDIIIEQYKRYAIYNRVQEYVFKDIVVTDEEIEAAYQELVAADKELYENNIGDYIYYNAYVRQVKSSYDSGADMDYAWYKPAGFRAVKHILLPVDETLMKAYTDLQARYEEQIEAAAAAAEAAAADATAEPASEPTAEPTATPEPVTEEQVQAAKDAIFLSLADTINEIKQKVSEGVDFDELIATYAVNADGSVTDPGMVNEPYKTSGYEVAAESIDYVKPFVDAAFSVNNIGDVSEPYLSDYGMHIVKYIADVAAGPVAMTDAQRAAKRETLLQSRKSETFDAAITQWLSEATVVYTGATPSLQELQAASAAQEAADGDGEAVDEQTAQDEMAQ